MSEIEHIQNLYKESLKKWSKIILLYQKGYLISFLDVSIRSPCAFCKDANHICKDCKIDKTICDNGGNGGLLYNDIEHYQGCGIFDISLLRKRIDEIIKNLQKYTGKTYFCEICGNIAEINVQQNVLTYSINSAECFTEINNSNDGNNNFYCNECYNKLKRVG